MTKPVCILLLALSKCGGDIDEPDCIADNWDTTAPLCGCGERQSKALSNRVHTGCRVLGCEHGAIVRRDETCVVDTCCSQ